MGYLGLSETLLTNTPEFRRVTYLESACIDGGVRLSHLHSHPVPWRAAWRGQIHNVGADKRTAQATPFGDATTHLWCCYICPSGAAAEAYGLNRRPKGASGTDRLMPTSVRSSILCGRGASGSASLASQSHTMPTPRRPNHLAFSNGANMGALPYDINTNLPFIGMRSARLAFEDVAAGRRIMCLVCGMTGVGKTLEARRALRKAGVPFHEFGVTPSERDLVKLMWFITCGIITYRGRRILVVIADDQDGLARRETILNHLKGMFGSDRRRVTFPSSEALRNEEYKNSENAKDRAKYRATIAPSGFDIDIRLIWLSNLDYTDPGIIATLPSHFHAMVSKGLDPLCIPNDAAHDGRDVFLFTHYLATEKNSLGGAGYSYEVARQAVRFYVENVHQLIDIPPRRLAMIAKVIKDNPDPAGRDERLAQMLRDTDQRPKLILPESWVPVLLWPTDPPHRAEAVPIVPPAGRDAGTATGNDYP